MAFPDQFALPKLLGLYVYAAFCAVRWVLALRQGRVHALPRALWLTAMAMACWWTATTLTAQHVTTALFGMRGRYNGLSTMLAELALFLFIAGTRMTQREVEQRLGAIGVALTVASAYALVQAAGLDPIQWPHGRPASTLGHPVIFAGVLAMALPLSLAFALDGRSRAARLAWGAMTLVQGLALILTLARGPWIAAVCGIIVLATLAVRHRRALTPRLAALAVCAILAMAAALAVSAARRAEVLGRVSTVTSLADDSSVSYRVHFCRAALAMLRDHPWVGVGWENFGLLYPGYRSAPTHIDRVGSRSDHGAQRAAADRRVGRDPGAGPADPVLRRRRSGRDPAQARRVRWAPAAHRRRVHRLRGRLSRAGPLGLAPRRAGPAGVPDLGHRRSPGACRVSRARCREADGRSSCSPRRSASAARGCRSTPRSAFARSG